MDHDKAERVVAHWLDDGADVVILREQTLDKPYGWVFFYQSRSYLQSGDDGERLVGNAPVIVNRFTNELVTLGTGRPVEESLAEYEASLPAAQLEARPQLRKRKQAPVDVRSFKCAVRNWTDLDVAAFHLGRSIGLLAADTDFASEAKHCFASENIVGSALYEALEAFARAGIIEKRDEPDVQVRWSDNSERNA